MRHPTSPSPDVFLRFTRHEAAALLLLLRIGLDTYEGAFDTGEARDELDRIPGGHIRSLMEKISAKWGDDGC